MNKRQMLRLFFRAIFLLDLNAMHDLGAQYGTLYDDGLCGKRALIIAVFFYRIASFWGHSESQYDLGVMIWRGELDGYDIEEGRKLIEKSAEKGFEPAVDLYNSIK